MIFILFNQYPVLVPFVAILAAEVLKAFIDWIRHRKTIRFLNSGGMPSGHSTFVASLVVLVALKQGIQSTLFACVSVLAVVVMYDALHIRYEAGRHAHFINALRHKDELDESLGHTHAEVIAGAFFGGLLSYFLLTGI